MLLKKILISILNLMFFKNFFSFVLTIFLPIVKYIFNKIIFLNIPFIVKVSEINNFGSKLNKI